MRFLMLAVALLTVASGALLLTGYLTRLAAIVAVLAGVVICSWFAAPTVDVLETRLTAALATVIAAAVVCLGPGAFSLDARLFGRREIIIPKTPNNT